MGKHASKIIVISVVFFAVMLLYPAENATGYVDAVHQSITGYAGNQGLLPGFGDNDDLPGVDCVGFL